MTSPYDRKGPGRTTESNPESADSEAEFHTHAPMHAVFDIRSSIYCHAKGPVPPRRPVPRANSVRTKIYADEVTATEAEATQVGDKVKVEPVQPQPLHPTVASTPVAPANIMPMKMP